MNIRLQTGCHWLIWMFWIGIIVPTISWAALPAGSIQGQIQTESGEPVAGALVIAAPSQAPADGSLGRLFQTVSAADGTFILNQIPGNVYWMCANLAGSQLLDPCGWSATPPTVDISEGGARTRVMVTLRQGTFVHIRINDSGYAMPAIAKLGGKAGVGGAPLTIQVGGARGIQQAQPVLDDDRGHLFRILVPFDTPLQLNLNPGQLRMSNQAGKQLTGSDLRQPFTVKKGDPPATFQFSVQAP